MHRFNADEIPPFIIADNSDSMRMKCILALFDFEQVTDGNSPKAQQLLKFDSAVCASGLLLNIADSGFFAEAKCLFKYKKKDVTINMIMKYENIRDDYYRWTVFGVNGLGKAGLVDTSHYGYINPTNHELHFSELSQAFPTMNGHFSKQHPIDILSYMAGLCESGTLQLIGCSAVVYWFTQVPGWVFSVSSHTRMGANSGWLIHDLMEVSDEQAKRHFIEQLIDKR